MITWYWFATKKFIKNQLIIVKKIHLHIGKIYIPMRNDLFKIFLKKYFSFVYNQFDYFE